MCKGNRDRGASYLDPPTQVMTVAKGCSVNDLRNLQDFPAHHNGGVQPHQPKNYTINTYGSNKFIAGNFTHFIRKLYCCKINKISFQKPHTVRLNLLYAGQRSLLHLIIPLIFKNCINQIINPFSI